MAATRASTIAKEGPRCRQGVSRAGPIFTAAGQLMTGMLDPSAPRRVAGGSGLAGSCTFLQMTFGINLLKGVVSATGAPPEVNQRVADLACFS